MVRFIPYSYDIILRGYLTTLSNRHDNSVFSREFFWNFLEYSKIGFFDHLKTVPACLKSVQFYTFCICIQEIFLIFQKILENFWIFFKTENYKIEHLDVY